jgi:hypothetical protein
VSALEADLRTFFEHYARTFHEDIGRFCDLYNFPSLTVRLDGTIQSFQTRDDAVLFFSRARQAFEDEGCRRWAIRAFTAERLGSGSAAATIDWDMMTANQARIRGWRQTYNVVGAGGRWKVVLSTLHRGSEVAYAGLPVDAR